MAALRSLPSAICRGSGLVADPFDQRKNDSPPGNYIYWISPNINWVLVWGGQYDWLYGLGSPRGADTDRLRRSDHSWTCRLYCRGSVYKHSFDSSISLA